MVFQDVPTIAETSIEIVLPDDGGVEILWHSLPRGGHSLELGKSLWVMDAFFEKIKFWFAYSHLSIKSKQALSSIIKRFKANWLES